MAAMATPPRKVSMLWPDPAEGPWIVDIWWRVQYGTAAPVGFALRAWVPGTESPREKYEEAMYDATLRGELRRNDDDEEPQYALPTAGAEVEFPSLTSSLLRSVPLGQLLDASRTDLADRFDFSAVTKESIDEDPLFPDGWTDALAGTIDKWKSEYGHEVDALRGPRGGRDLGDAHYVEVATVYRNALREGNNPTAAVAAHFTVSKSAAAKKVSRARDRGFLPPTTKGRTGRLTEEL